MPSRIGPVPEPAAPAAGAAPVGRVGFIHTVSFLVETFRAEMRRALPGVDVFHILDESLLQDLLRGRLQTAVYRRVGAQVFAAVDAGADLVVMTCSSTSPAVDAVRSLVACPVIKIDDPMAAAAVAAGARIGLLCTASSTVGPSTALLEAHAARQGRPVTVTPLLQAPAYAALMAGNRAEHDRLIRTAAEARGRDFDVLVLAQASLAPLRDDLAASLPIPVLASPPLLMETLVCLCDGSAPRA